MIFAPEKLLLFTRLAARLGVLLAAALLALAGCGGSGGASGPPETTGGGAGAPVPERLSAAELGERLSRGGYVVYLRHAETDLSESDAELRDLGDLSDCSRQRDLTARGREQAERIGAAFRRAEVPVGEVLASPYCRNLKTAELAFGRVQPTERLLSPEYVPEGEAARFADFASVVRGLLAEKPPAGENTVLVGHESVLRAVTGESVEEGGAVVFQPLGGERYRLVGYVGPEDWATLSREN